MLEIAHALETLPENIADDEYGPGFQFQAGPATLRIYPEFMTACLTTPTISITLHNVVIPDCVQKGIVVPAFDVHRDVELALHPDGTFELTVIRPPAPPRTR